MKILDGTVRTTGFIPIGSAVNPYANAKAGLPPLRLIGRPRRAGGGSIKPIPTESTPAPLTTCISYVRYTCTSSSQGE